MKSIFPKSKIAIFFFILFTLFFVVSAFGQGTFNSASTGNWTASASWTLTGGTDADGVPDSDDTVTIISNHTITVNTGSQACSVLTIGPTNNNISTLTFTNGTTLTVAGTVSLGNSGNNNRRGAIVMTNGGTLICQGFVLNNAGSNVFTPGTGTVQLTANNTLPTTIFTSFNNLTISSGTTNLGVNTTIGGVLSLSSGSLNVNGFTGAAGAITGSGELTNIGVARVFTIGSLNTNTTYSGIISSSTPANLAITKTGTGKLNISGMSTFTGATTVNNGILELDSADRIANASTVTLGGGTFSTGSSSGFNETIGVLTLSANSSINLGTGLHTLTVANSSAASWGAFTLTINGWTGTAGVTGTAGKIQVGVGGLTDGQLANVRFTGYPIGAVITALGELVPPPAAVPTTSVGTYTNCIDNPTALTSATTASGQFATINIVKGFTYSFSVGNVFTSSNEILTLLDMTNNPLTPPITNGGTNGTTITNWVATFSGQVKLVLSSSNGVNGLTGGVMTIQLNALGNTQDSQTAFGTNTWVGHIYNSVAGNAPEPFTNANYAGYYNLPSETISESFGGNTTCFNVLSNGTTRTQIYTETFAVRYRMKTTKSGCFFINFRGDDGIRMTLNGQNVFNRWVDQSPTTYNGTLIRLDGDDDFVFDFYENGGGNELNFTLVPFDANSNTITAPTQINFCSNGDPAIIEGSLQYSSSNPALPNPQLNFQWQLSTDGGAFANITGTTARTYDPPAIANATAVNIVRRFKRLVTFNTASIPDINGVRTLCVYNESNIVTITTSPNAIPTQPLAISGTQPTQCATITGQIYFVPAVANATTYTWTVPTGWTITAGQGTNSITVTTGTTVQTGTISVTAANGCGTSAARTLAITTVNPLPTIVAAPSATSVCQGITSSTLSYTATGTPSIYSIIWDSAATTAGFTPVTNSSIPNPTNGNIPIVVPSGVAAATYNGTITVRNGNNCTSLTDPFTITVNATPTITTTGTVAPVCFNVSSNTTTVLAYTATTGTPNSYSIDWNAAANTAGLTDQANTTLSFNAGAGNVNITIPANVAVGIYNGVMTIGTGNCSATQNVSVTITPNIAASVSITFSPFTVICSGTNVTFTATPTNGGTSPIYQWKLNGSDVGSNSATYSNNTLANGDLVMVEMTSNATCVTGSPAISNTVTIGVFPIKTYTASGWSPSAPTITDAAIISSDYNEATDINACSLTVNNNAVVIIPSGKNVTLTGALTVSSGSFTLENTANLVQTTNVSNSGAITVKRNSSLLKRLDYTLWSSPVTGQGLYAFSKTTLPNRFYVYDTTSNLYSNSVGFNLTDLQYPSPLVAPNGINGSDNANVTFTTGKGYLIRMPWDHPTAPTVWNGQFTGVPNNGTILYTMSTAGNGFNAIGNPYPSRLNVHNFIVNNPNIDGTLYLWRKTNNTAVTSYATLTTTAYTANGVAGGDTGAGFFNTGDEANWVLNIGQGFIVKATGTTLAFTNTMRRSSTSDQFFRNSPIMNTDNTGLYWLNLNTSEGNYSQMAVGYSVEGTLAIDRGIDGKNINEDFYLTSLIGTETYAIQGRPQFQPADVVPLSYKVTTAGTYSISIDHTSGLFSTGQIIYLRDTMTNTLHNLNGSFYSFTSGAGTFANRFEVVYQSQLDVNNPSLNENQVIIYKNEVNDFVVNTGNVLMASIKVFDIRGRLIVERKNINAFQTSIKAGNANEVLLVQITAEDGAVVTKKAVR